jgi:hypothetical protein
LIILLLFGAEDEDENMILQGRMKLCFFLWIYDFVFWFYQVEWIRWLNYEYEEKDEGVEHQCGRDDKERRKEKKLHSFF